MGSDLLLIGLAIPVGREPDWNAGTEWIASLTEEDAAKLIEREPLCYGGLGEDEHGHVLDGVREELTDLLARFRGEFDEERNRHLEWLELGGHRLYLTGGLSSGDSPTDAFDVFNDVIQAGLDEVCGFSEAKIPWDSISEVVNYSWDAERRDYEEQLAAGEIVPNDADGFVHVYVHLQGIRKWLNEVVKVTAPTEA